MLSRLTAACPVRSAALPWLYQVHFHSHGLRILGPLEVLDEGRSIALGGGKQRALLALLLLHPNETLSTDRLIDELFGEQASATAAKTVQVYISRLRKALAAGARDGGEVVTRERGYELRLDPDAWTRTASSGWSMRAAASWPRAGRSAPPRRSLTHLRCGVAPRLPSSRTSRSSSARSRGSTISASPRWSGRSRRNWRSASTPR